MESDKDERRKLSTKLVNDQCKHKKDTYSNVKFTNRYIAILKLKQISDGITSKEDTIL